VLDHDSVVTVPEIGANSVEAREPLHDRQRDVVRAAAAGLQAKIERSSDEWLRSEFGSDPAGRSDALAERPWLTGFGRDRLAGLVIAIKSRCWATITDRRRDRIQLLSVSTGYIRRRCHR
jgi:hypothetical protein